MRNRLSGRMRVDEEAVTTKNGIVATDKGDFPIAVEAEFCGCFIRVVC